MTKQEYKKQNGAARKLANRIEAWHIWARGMALLKAVKAECGLDKQGDAEREQMEREERNAIDDAVIKEAGFSVRHHTTGLARC